MEASRAYRCFKCMGTAFVVDQRYSNLVPIGRGAYGHVVSADDSVTRQKVAIKRIGRLFTSELLDAKRAVREIKVLRDLRGHEHVAHIVDVMTEPRDDTRGDAAGIDALYIVTVAFDCNLHDVIRNEPSLIQEHVRFFMFQLVRGLRWMHMAGILHRDIKPTNVVVNKNCAVALCDFGLARLACGNEDRTPDLSQYVTTRWYRAPEILCDAPSYGFALDMWSVGCVLAELLGRKTLFAGASTGEQLKLIVAALGIPSDDVLARNASPVNAKAIAAMRGSVPQPATAGAADWQALFPDAPREACDILARMLQFDQHARISAHDALCHPYLRGINESYRDDAPFARRGDAEFDRSCEQAATKQDVQRLMRAQMRELRAELRAETSA